MRKTLLAVCCSLMACGNIDVSPEDLQNIKSNMGGVSDQFTTKLWSQIENESEGKNYFISPTSLQTALGMLLNGAKGQTATEMKTALSLTEPDPQAINQAYKDLIRSLPNADPSVKFNMANSIWMRTSIPFSDEFVSINKQYFDAEVQSLAFDATAVKKINDWASNQTSGKIKKVIDEIDDSKIMFLMNAIYFKGSWASPFDKELTADESFNGATKTSTVPMMNKYGKFGFADTEQFKVLELPYGKGLYSMYLLLPKTNQNISKLNLDQALGQLNTTTVNLKLPKFTLEYEKNLNNVLKKMGMLRAFTEQADFTGLVKTEAASTIKPLVSFVKQNTFVAVDEVGTEAAAVTTIGVGVTSAPVNIVDFFCNKPFYFLIREKTSGQNVFLGSIKNL